MKIRVTRDKMCRSSDESGYTLLPKGVYSEDINLPVKGFLAVKLFNKDGSYHGCMGLDRNSSFETKEDLINSLNEKTDNLYELID
jgi:hypothetical protein